MDKTGTGVRAVRQGTPRGKVKPDPDLRVAPGMLVWVRASHPHGLVAFPPLLCQFCGGFPTACTLLPRCRTHVMPAARPASVACPSFCAPLTPPGLGWAVTSTLRKRFQAPSFAHIHR